MADPLNLALAFVTGALLGVVFYGGLWWTVRKAVSSQQPALWFFGSQLVRMGVVLVGFYLVSDGRWERLVACLVGFVLARMLVVRFTGPPLEAHDGAAKEADHAS